MFVCRKGSASVSTSWSGGSAGRLSSAKWWSARSSGWKTSKTRRGVSNQRAGTFSIGWQERQEQNARRFRDRKEHTSELQSLMRTSYAVFCLKKKNTINTHTQPNHHTAKNA